MKRKLLSLAVCFLFVGAVAASGQTKSFTYKANNGNPSLTSEDRRDLIITITPGPNGYTVSGEMLWGDGQSCDIHGVYHPESGALRASCGASEINIVNARKVPGEDALQIQEPFAAIARRLGAKPPVKNGAGGNKPGFSLSGSWKCDDGAGTFELTQSGSSLTWEGKSADGGKTWDHTYTGEITGNEIKGSYKDHEPGIVRQSGKVNFKIISNDKLQRTYSDVAASGCGTISRQ